MGVLDEDRSPAATPVADQEEATAEEPEDTVDPQEQQQEVWAQNEGYTPLSDMNMNHMSVMVSMGPGNEDDDSDSTDNVGSAATQGASSAFFVNPLAFSTADDDSDFNTSTYEQTMVPGNTFQRIPTSENPEGENTENGHNDDDDFQSIANRALSLLDEEYERTLRGEQRPPNWETSQEASAAAVDGISTSTASELKESKDGVPVAPTEQEKDDIRAIAAAFDERKEVVSKGGFMVDWNLSPPAHPSTIATDKADTKVDTDAVRKVVASLSQKPDNSFQQKFAMWQERQQTLPVTHDLIPEIPYKAFRRKTDKAKLATASLSRSATLAEALLRLKESKLLPTASDSLLIDIVGVDHVECDSVDRIQSTFRPIIRWIGAWKDHAFKTVHLRLIGRDLTQSAAASTASVDLLMPKSSSVLRRAFATCHSGVYHEWLDTMQTETSSTDKALPDLMIAYNAGIWGYNEWIPTIQYLCEQTLAPVPTVITAYTLEECQEDLDVIRKALVNGKSKLLWAAERNPFGSKVVRDTKSSSNEHHENSSWQGWLLGGG